MSESIDLRFVCEQTESDEVFSCYIPEIDKHFTANTLEQAKQIIKSIIDGLKSD